MEKWMGPLCAVSAAATWAIGSTGYSRLTKDYSVFSINFVRALIALPLFVLVTFLTSGGFSNGIVSFQNVRASHWGWFTLSMVSSYGVGDSCFFLSSQSLGVPGALAIASSYPIWTVLAGYWFGHESISLGQGLGLLMTVIGIIAVILNGPQPKGGGPLLPQSRFSWVGVGLALLTSIAWAVNGFAVSRGGVDLPPSVGNTVRMILALFLSGCIGKIFAPQRGLLLPSQVISKYGWIFVLEAFFGSFLYLYGLSHSPLVLGSTLSSLAPVISVPVAWILGFEKFSLFRSLGVVCVVLGVFFLMT